MAWILLLPLGGPQWCEIDTKPFLGKGPLSSLEAYPDKIIVVGSRKSYRLDFNALANSIDAISGKIRDVLMRVCPEQVATKQVAVVNKSGDLLECPSEVYILKVLRTCDALISTPDSMYQPNARWTPIFNPWLLEPFGDRRQPIDHEKISGLHIWYEHFGRANPRLDHIFVSDHLKAELEKAGARQVDFAYCRED